MTPLEAARQLVKIQPLEEDCGKWVCRVCGEYISGYPEFAGHERDCPWLSMPQIVAALEAATTILSRQEPYVVQPRSLDAAYVYCGGTEPPLVASHAGDCLWLAAQKALEG